MKSLSYFTRYSSAGATSRQRSLLFSSHLLNQNYNIDINNFFYSSYINDLYMKRISLSKVFSSYFKRFFSMMTSSNFLVIEYELFPYIPFFLENIFLKRKKYILDFDDNVWEKYKNNYFLKNKFSKLVKKSSGVIVGNDFLLEKVKKDNFNIIKIPTCVSIRNRSFSIKKFKKFTIAWIGTPVTYKYIESFKEVFIDLSKIFSFDLLIIASKDLENRKIANVSMRFEDWSIENEYFLLKKSHVGIMPLTEDPFSKGKSAFKLIQYLVAGIPVIASPVGENSNIVNDDNGFLVNSLDDWINAMKILTSDEEYYNNLAYKAFSDGNKFLIENNLSLYENFLVRCLFTENKVE